MIKLGAEADIREKLERQAHSQRPVNVHMARAITILGIKFVRLHSVQAKSPGDASTIANAWAKQMPDKAEQVTIWTD